MRSNHEVLSMKRVMYLVPLIAALSLFALNAGAAGQATPDEAKEMAIKAAEYLKSAGTEKAFAEFDAKDNSTWHDRDLYVTVQDSNGVMVAHGTNPGLIGKSVLELKDVDGKPFNHEIQAIKDQGWVEFKWQNPMSKVVEAKRTYEVRVGEYIVGAGAYAK
jgi:signal transduction histidine kinase